MKKISVFVLVLFLTVTTCFAYTVPDNTIVYVTPQGEKYHREDCSYTTTVRGMTIEEAERRGYGPCSRCDPDYLTGKYTSDWEEESKGTSKSESSTVFSVSGTAEPEERRESNGYQFWLVVVVAIVIFYSVRGVVHHHNAKREEMVRRREVEQEKEKERQKREMYISMYEGKSAAELAGIPDGVEIGFDGLPKRTGSPKWGEPFTFYVSGSGKAYHRKRGCSGARIAIHACLIKGRYACKNCRPSLPNLSWYKEYQKIKAIKDKYQIE